MGRGMTYDEFKVGDVFKSQGRTVTEADVVAFAGVAGDFNPLHTDETYAARTPFGHRIAHGMLIASIATGLANLMGIFEGTTIALLEQVIRYTGAVQFLDTVHLEMTVNELKPSSKADRGVVVFDANVVNQEGSSVIEGQWTLLMRRSE